MKPIEFKESASQKVYDDYINRIKRVASELSAEDKNDIVMEFNSHIYEGFRETDRSKFSEIDGLLDVLERLGPPEEVLKPQIAELKLNQATRTFNPKHIFRALALNLSNGVFYVFISILYLLLFGFVFVIIAKIINPDEVGLYFKHGKFLVLGILDQSSKMANGTYEVLGNWFIPVMILFMVLSYLFITFILRLKRRKKQKI